MQTAKVDRSLPLQASFSELEYAAKKRKTRRDRFLAEIEAVTPWAASLAAIEPFYPKGGSRPSSDRVGEDTADVHCPAVLRSVG